MAEKILLSVEAMTLGVKRMADHAKTLGYRLELLAADPSMYADRADTSVTVFPTQDKEALTSYVKENRANIGGIFSSTDTWGVAAAELREEFGFPSRITAEKLINMRDKSWVAEKIGAKQDETVFPLIAKPRSGTGSKNIHLLSTPEEYDAFVASSEDADTFLFQPFYRGPLYSAEVWSNGQSAVFFGVTNRTLTKPPRFLEEVKSFPHAANTPWEKEVEAWTMSLMSALDYDLGLAHIEFIETCNGFKLVEINARMAGALITPAIDQCTNYDPYALAIADALDTAPELPKTREITGGHSHVSLYANRLGKVADIRGVETITQFPGDVGWIASKEIGATVTEVDTYRARLGNVFATGPNASVAQDRALSAAASIKVEIE